MNDIRNNLLQIRERIRRAATDSGRNPQTVRLVAVSKTAPADSVREAIAAGVTILGESYLQEARSKIEALASIADSVAWHFIGHLQTNKARHAVRLFDLIHSVDSLRLAQALDREAAKIGKIQPVLIQVNVAGEATKSGVAISAARKLVADAAGLKNLRVQGLMTMPPYFGDPEKARPFFDALMALRDAIRQELDPSRPLPPIPLEELSMGMSGDFETAISAGATLVRIGTAIFGERA